MRTIRWAYLGLILASAAALGFLVYSMPGPHSESEDERTEAGPPVRSAGVERFRFPDDRGGKLLEELLPPGEPVTPPAPERSLSPPRGTERVGGRTPEAPLPPIAPELPRPNAVPAGRPVRPRLLPEEPPLSRALFTPVLPDNPKLPAGAGVRLPSPPVDEPPPLPILAQHPVDRGAPEDPTAAFAALMALSARLPDRLTPVPFLRVVIPDPFIHYREVRSGKEPVEEKLPLMMPRLPGK